MGNNKCGPFQFHTAEGDANRIQFGMVGRASERMAASGASYVGPNRVLNYEYL